MSYRRHPNTPEVNLQPLSPARALQQSWTINYLVNKNAHWLAVTNPDVVDIYGGSKLKTLAAVWRHKAVTDVTNYIVEIDASAYGMASISTDTVDIQSGSLTGRRLDYWVTPRFNERIHQAIGQALVWKCATQPGDLPLFGLINRSEDLLLAPTGLTKVLPLVIKNAVLGPSDLHSHGMTIVDSTYDIHYRSGKPTVI